MNTGHSRKRLSNEEYDKLVEWRHKRQAQQHVGTSTQAVSQSHGPSNYHKSVREEEFRTSAHHGYNPVNPAGPLGYHAMEPARFPHSQKRASTYTYQEPQQQQNQTQYEQLGGLVTTDPFLTTPLHQLVQEPSSSVGYSTVKRPHTEWLSPSDLPVSKLNFDSTPLLHQNSESLVSVQTPSSANAISTTTDNSNTTAAIDNEFLKATSPIQCLPSEVLVHILSFLDNMNRKDLYTCLYINKNFYHCTQDVLWRTPRFATLRAWLEFQKRIMQNVIVTSQCDATTMTLGSSPSSAPVSSSSASSSSSSWAFTLSKPTKPTKSLLPPPPPPPPPSNIHTLAKMNRSVRHLDFSILPVFGDLSQREIVTELAPGCPMVHTINLYRCSWINDTFMLQLTQSCRFIRSLTLSYCSKITDTSLEAMATYLPNLKLLILRECERITDKGLIALAQSDIRTLSSLSLANCSRITDNGMMALLSSNIGSSLQHLVLSKCHLLTDSTLVAVSNHARKQLHTIHLSSNPNYSETGIRFIVDNCPKLKSLYVESCPLVSNTFVSFVKSKNIVVFH